VPLPTSWDGVLLTDSDSLDSYSYDVGGWIIKKPSIVLEAASLNDLKKIFLYSTTNKVPLAFRGRGHAAGGQTLVENGLVVTLRRMCNTSAITINAADPSVTASAGCLWSDVISAVAADGRFVIPVLPNSVTLLTVGGTLSAGGISRSSNRYGFQVDNILEAKVLKLDGTYVTATRSRHADLLRVLSGNGKFGAMVEIKMKLIPKSQNVFVMVIERNSSFADHTALLDLLSDPSKDPGSRFDYVEGSFDYRAPPRSTFRAAIVLAVHYDSVVPDAARLLQGITDVYNATLKMTKTESWKDFSNDAGTTIVGQAFSKDITNNTKRDEALKGLEEEERVLRSKRVASPASFLQPFYSLTPESQTLGWFNEFHGQILGLTTNPPLKGLQYTYFFDKVMTPNFPVPTRTGNERTFRWLSWSASFPAAQANNATVWRQLVLQAYNRLTSAYGGTSYTPDLVPTKNWQQQLQESFDEFQLQRAVVDPMGLLTPGQTLPAPKVSICNN